MCPDGEVRLKRPSGHHLGAHGAPLGDTFFTSPQGRWEIFSCENTYFYLQEEPRGKVPATKKVKAVLLSFVLRQVPALLWELQHGTANADALDTRSKRDCAAQLVKVSQLQLQGLLQKRV